MFTKLEAASREDLLAPDTWKGMANMIANSTQFQVGQAKEKMNEQLVIPPKMMAQLMEPLK
jgi:hypothetical protein